LALRWSFVLIYFLSLSTAVGAVESRNKVEELFIWKISDELKLSVPDEKSLSDLLRGLNQRRAQVNEELQATLKKMATATTQKDREKVLNEHRKLLKSYSDLSIEEVDRIQKMLGSEKAAQYFVLKNDLTNRLKSMLATPENRPAQKLGPPKVIEGD
jgi:hypothetical protein